MGGSTNRPLINNITTSAWHAGWAISVPLGGLIIKEFSYRLSFYATFVVYCAYILMAYLFLNRYKDKNYRPPEENFIEEDMLDLYI